MRLIEQKKLSNAVKTKKHVEQHVSNLAQISSNGIYMGWPAIQKPPNTAVAGSRRNAGGSLFDGGR